MRRAFAIAAGAIYGVLYYFLAREGFAAECHYCNACVDGYGKDV